MHKTEKSYSYKKRQRDCGRLFHYCESLNQITYEGSLADWNAVKKNTNWDSHAVDIESPLAKIQCLDGYMEYVTSTKTWKEVKA